MFLFSSGKMQERDGELNINRSILSESSEDSLCTGVCPSCVLVQKFLNVGLRIVHILKNTAKFIITLHRLSKPLHDFI